MELYIQVENGQTVNHPALAANLIAAFGEIPSNWEPFLRTDPPVRIFGEAKKIIETYVPNPNGGWMDGWVMRDTTDEEKAEYVAYMLENPPVDLSGNPMPNSVFDYKTHIWTVYKTKEGADAAAANNT